MNKKQLIKSCLINSDAIETKPFKEEQYKDLVVIRHKSNNKGFALIFEQEGRLFVNLKAPPEIISLLKEQYSESVFPAWHMNKTHWCKVDVEKIQSEILGAIIKTSFEITAPKKKKSCPL